ncbi:MAG: hypothetical protein HY040_25355 [Planctomycetes bacterium]|nr:hypothetical protein [Planctomycetota bacterium]
MNRWRFAFVAVLGLWALPSLAQAQPRLGSYQRPQVNPNPTFSPYLNLVRGGAGGVANTAIDYYGIVRPQLDFRNNVTTLQQQLQGIQMQQTQQATEAEANIPATGRAVGGFLNYSHFFPQMTQGGGNRPAPTGSAGQR